jgi:hypothetical protein
MTKLELQESREAYKITKNIALELTSLKKVYSNNLSTKKSLQKILKHRSLSSSKIIQNFKKSSATINSEGMDINALNLLMGKLLNNSYNIKSLSIYRLSDTHVSLKMEIKW